MHRPSSEVYVTAYVRTMPATGNLRGNSDGGSRRALPSVACSSQNVQAHPEVEFFCGKTNTHPSYFVFVFVLFVSSCVSLVAVRTKWVMD